MDKLRRVLHGLKVAACTVFVLAAVGALVWMAANLGPFLYRYFFQSEVIDGFRLMPEGEVAAVADYSGSERAVVMPGELNGLPVTKVYAAGDAGKLIRELTLPDSMRINVDCMIWHFAAVDRFYVSDTHPEYISVDGVLYSRDGRTLVCCPPGRMGVFAIPEGVETIGSCAFVNSCLTAVEIPESVRTIQQLAFVNMMSMQTLEIPPTVETVEAEAIYQMKSLPDIRLIVTEGSAAAQAAAEYAWPVEALLPAAGN